MGSGNRSWIIFDADNTLWTVEHLYDTARAQMCVYLGELGIDPAQAEAFQRERDRRGTGVFFKKDSRPLFFLSSAQSDHPSTHRPGRKDKCCAALNPSGKLWPH
jgi:hypothetical protein